MLVWSCEKRKAKTGSAVGTGEATLSSSPAQGATVVPKLGLEYPRCWSSPHQPLLGMEGLLQPRAPGDAQSCLLALPLSSAGGFRQRWPSWAGVLSTSPLPQGWWKDDPEGGHCHRATPKQQ